MSIELTPDYLRAWIALRTRKVCATKGCSSTAEKGAKLCKACIASKIKRFAAKASNAETKETNLYAIITDDPFTPQKDGIQSVKFGIAADPRSRLKELQTGSSVKLKLYGYVPCCASLERVLHSKLNRHRRQGEWFAACGDARQVMGWVASKKADKIYEYCGLSKFRKLLDPQEDVPR